MEELVADATGRTATRTTQYGWVPLLALASTQLLENGERQALSQALEGIQAEFAVSDAVMGLLPFAMAIVGALGSIPIGILSDRMRRTALLAAAMLIWTFAIGLTALSTTFMLLFVMRMVLGAVEANAPAAVSLVSDYYPVRQRAKMLGLYQAGGLAGGLLGLTLGGVAVELGGWRWAFGMWVPAGLVVVWWLWRTQEPTRGDRDRDFEAELSAQDDAPTTPETPSGGTKEEAGGLLGGIDPTEAARQGRIELPEPHRVGDLDYGRLTQREAVRELVRIRSLWFAIVGLGASFLLLQGLSFWGVEFFRRVHGLGSAAAGALTGGLALGAAIGIVAGGFLSDRFFNQGVLAARVWVTGLSAVAASAVLVPAFASSNLLVTAPLMIVGGMLMTIPVAPAEAMLNDVVVPQLRGRALTLRTIIRSGAMVGPLLIGVISDVIGLQAALVVFTPVYAVGGLIVLLGVRYYPRELAFVVAETRREREEDEDRGRAEQGPR